MRAHEIGLGMDQSHYILQLVAKTECAAGLVKGAARPYPACQGLVYEPAVGLYVQGLIGRLDAHGAQSVDPVLRDFFRSEEHTSELQSLMSISYAVFCLKKKKLENNTYN